MKTERREKWGHAALDYGIILVGGALYALAVSGFIRPINVPLGGVSGVAQVVSHLSGLPMGSLIIAINIPLFLFSYRELGRRFIGRSLAAILCSSLLIDLLKLPPITDNPLLGALYGGVLMGAGLGLVFSRGGTTGGSDIVAKLIHLHREHLSVGKIGLAVNAVVIAGASVVFSGFTANAIEPALFAIVIQFVSSTVVDAILHGVDNAKCALIVTGDAETLSQVIHRQMHRGVTGLSGEGMYTKTQRTVLMVAVRGHEIGPLKHLVRQVDAEAFIIMLSAGEVLGKGFKTG